jgi:hypothetical protein
MLTFILLTNSILGYHTRKIADMLSVATATNILAVIAADN